MGSGNNSVVRALDLWSKGYSSNPCRGGGRMFFTRVDFLCWLFFQYLFHPCVTAVACKRPQSICQKCMWQVAAKHTCTLCMWLCMKWHGAWLYGVHRTCRDGNSFMWYQPCQHCKYTTLVDVQKHAIHSCRITCERSGSAEEWRIALHKSNQQQLKTPPLLFACQLVNMPWQALGQGGGALWLVDYHWTDCQFLPRPISRNNNKSV